MELTISTSIALIHPPPVFAVWTTQIIMGLLKTTANIIGLIKDTKIKVSSRPGTSAAVQPAPARPSPPTLSSLLSAVLRPF